LLSKKYLLADIIFFFNLKFNLFSRLSLLHLSHPSLVKSLCVFTKVLLLCNAFHLTFAGLRSEPTAGVSVSSAHCKPGAAGWRKQGL